MIQHQKPITHKSKLQNWIGLFIMIFLYLIWIDTWLDDVPFIFLNLIFVFGLLILLTEFFEKKFDGWEICNDTISLTRVDLFRRVEIQTLKFNKIDNIVYIRSGSGNRFSFKFNSDKHTYLLIPPMDIYKFGKTLKFLKNQGIRIDFSEKDHEIELYLNDVINSIPMANNNKSNS